MKSVLSLSTTAVRRTATDVAPQGVRALSVAGAGVDGGTYDGGVSAGLLANMASGMNVADSIRSPQIKPIFWNGVPPIDPAEVIIDCSNMDLKNGFPAELVERMNETYDATGLIYVRNTGLEGDMAAMGALAREVLPDTLTYTGGANSRQELEKNIYETGVSNRSYIHYHHEMAYLKSSTSAIAFLCYVSPPGKGETYVSRAELNTDAILKTTVGQKLKERNISYIRCLTDRRASPEGADDPSNDDGKVYNHWQTSFGVETEEEANALAEAKGLEVEWDRSEEFGSFMRTRFTVSAFEYFPKLDRNMLYSSVADDSMWFDTWPGVRDLPTMPSFSESTPDTRPLKITYGDGSDFTRQELVEYVEVYDRHSMPIPWASGEIAVVCNHRWAHGRPAFSLEEDEERTLGVILGPMYDRVGQRDDKW